MELFGQSFGKITVDPTVEISHDSVAFLSFQHVSTTVYYSCVLFFDLSVTRLLHIKTSPRFSRRIYYTIRRR